MREYQERAGGGYMCQKTVQNPHASAPLVIPFQVLRNTTRSNLNENIEFNSALPLPWVALAEAHDREAVLVGGGPSAGDDIEEIKARQAGGAMVFAMNGAARWLRERGVMPDAQVMVDARIDSLHLLDPAVPTHFLASQVDPAMVAATSNPVIFHIGMDGIDALLPVERIVNLPLLGGGASVGMTAVCLAHVQGYRTLHCYGYDSSHAEGASHAYAQPMNDKIPTCETEWAGKVYTSSVAMKAQAEWFMILARQLKDAGCALHVHGTGLLPAMFNTPPEALAERDKYRLMWGLETYRAFAPGEVEAERFLEIAKPDGLVIDFGCGTGRGALAIAKAGHRIFLLDFAGNCRDQEALALPFMDCDLTQPIAIKGEYGFCTDVMEHIPPEDTHKALGNMFASTPRVYFRIDTEADNCGALIGATLHMAVRSHDEWRDILSEFGAITHEEARAGHSIFYVEKA